MRRQNEAQDSSRAFCCMLWSHTIVERPPNCFLKQLFIQPKVMNWSLLPRFYRYCPPFIPSVVFAFNTTYQPTHRSLFTFRLLTVFVCHVFPKSNKSTCLNPQKFYKQIIARTYYRKYHNTIHTIRSRPYYLAECSRCILLFVFFRLSLTNAQVKNILDAPLEYKGEYTFLC